MASVNAGDRQIRQMVEFIRLEAKEKTQEIRAKAKADADVEKQMTVLNAKNKLAEEYDRKEKELAVDQRIAASMAESKQRSRLLSARDEYVQKLHAEAKSRLSVVASTNAQAYTVLLKGLIKQAIVSLEGETAVVVQCRPQDLAVAQKAGAAAAAEVAAEAKAAGGSRTVAVSVAADTALAGSAGGVNVTGAAGRIKCSNTLEARVDLAFGDLTPVVRDLLYPSARAPQLVKPPINFPHQNAHVHAPAPAPAPAVKAVVHAPKAAAPASHPMLDPDGVFAAASASTTVKAVEPAAGSATATDPFGF